MSPHIITAVAAALILSAGCISAPGKNAAAETHVEVDARDGSRLLGTITLRSIPLHTSIGEVDIPLSSINELAFLDDRERSVVRFRNGDRLTGVILLDALEIQSIAGPISLGLPDISKVLVRGQKGAPLRKGKGEIAFGGVRWDPLRIAFAVEDGRLMTLPKPRAGFQYGHSGHGRDSVIVANLGDEAWRDYAVEFDFGTSPPDRSWNPFGIDDLNRGLYVMFRLQDFKESWNEPGLTGYRFTVNAKGGWGLSRGHNVYCPSRKGYSAPLKNSSVPLATGQEAPILADGRNHLRLEVQGRRIRIWLNDQEVVDCTDDEDPSEAGHRPFDYGGIALSWRYESMGWIENFRAHSL